MVIGFLVVSTYFVTRNVFNHSELQYITNSFYDFPLVASFGYAWLGMLLDGQYFYYKTCHPVICVIQIKICAEYRDMLPRPRLVCQEPGLRPIGRSPGVPDKSSRGLGSMSRYSAQILICFIAYIFHFLFLWGFGWELCRNASMHSALCHCPL